MSSMQQPSGAFGSKLLTTEFLTGLFFVGALIILFYFTAMIRGKDILFGAKQHPITVKFPSTGNLSVNDKVRVIGVEMGQVKRIALTGDNNEALVLLHLKKDIPLYKDYKITIQSSSVFGGGYIYIYPGIRESGPADMSQPLQGKPAIDIIYEASGLIAALKTDEERLREAVLDGKFFESIRDAAKSFEANSKEFNLICADLRAGKGTLGKLFADQSVYDEAKKAFENLGEASGKIVSLVGDLQSGKGSLGKIISDDKAYDSMMDSMGKLRDVASKISSGEGTLGKFVNDKGELYDTIGASMKVAEDVAMQIRDGKGTIGMMLKDDSLYVELKEAVRQFRAAIEDYREMSPIATFGSMLLGAL